MGAPLTEQEQYERDDRYIRTLEKYRICKYVRQKRGDGWVTYHGGRIKKPLTTAEMRKDMIANQCHFKER